MNNLSLTCFCKHTQSGVAPKAAAKRQETEDDSEEEEDGVDLQGRTITAAGMEVRFDLF